MAVHRCQDCETAHTITRNLPIYLERLEACEPIGMDTEYERNTLHQRVPQRGVYAFYEGCVAVYVGRSKRLSNRVLEHGQPSASHTGTPVATRIARGETADELDVALPIAKEVVRTMTVRAVEIHCPNAQAIFEIYAHVALGHTRYNKFDTT